MSDGFVVLLVGTVDKEPPKHFSARSDARAFAKKAVDDGTAERAEIYTKSAGKLELAEAISDHMSDGEIKEARLRAIRNADLETLAKMLGI